MGWRDVLARIGGDASTNGCDPDAPLGTALAEANRLAEYGRAIQAVDLLAAANRRKPDPIVELRLVGLRHDAVAQLSSSGRSPWPPVYDDLFPDAVGRLPEITPAELNPQVLGGAVAHHGCLVVRGLFGEAPVSRTIDSIHNAEVRRDGGPAEGRVDRWYQPFDKVNGMDAALRRMVARQGGTWLADSPASTAQVLDDMADAGAVKAIAGHFGERPLFSLQKSTLRRSAPIHTHASFHQDGSFLGPRARAMNVWVALTACGGDIPTPGMELVPRRFEEILPADGGFGTASISRQTVLRVAADTPPIHPEFQPGDAMLFDERFLHRTYLPRHMTQDRYAIECWFFAPAYDAKDYVSFLA